MKIIPFKIVINLFVVIILLHNGLLAQSNKGKLFIIGGGDRTDNLMKKMLAVSHLTKNDYIVVLDERGKQFTSPQLALFLEQRANESTRQLIFIIGGAFGVDELIQKRANHTWSLSNLVFPHHLVRLMLAEQLYRACTIIRNEKYHHS